MRVMGLDGEPEAFLAERSEQWIVGTVDEVVERILEHEAAGVERVMLQHLAHDDLEMVALIGSKVLPRVSAT